MNTHKSLVLLFTFACLSGLFSSCNKEEDPDPSGYQIPTSYSFENVDYSGQTARLQLLSDLSTLAKSASDGASVSRASLQELWENTQNVYGEGKRLSDKCYPESVGAIEGYFDEIERISQLSTPGAEGVAGIDGGRLFDENGFEIAQLIEKEIMGAVLYYQATSVYLSEDKMEVDNSTVTPGEGTAMEHHFDEAFGYLGVPVDFNENKDGLLFFGKYCHSLDEQLGTDDRLFNAFLQGRAAISNDDMAARDEAISTIRNTWEEVVAGSAVHYLNAAMQTIANRSDRNHSLSEAIAFIRSLRYNIARRVSDAQLTSIENSIGSNLDQVSIAGIQSARDALCELYGWTAISDQL